MSAENARRARWEAESRRKIEKISKKCPGCGTNTEKNGNKLRQSIIQGGGFMLVNPFTAEGFPIDE